MPQNQFVDYSSYKYKKYLDDNYKLFINAIYKLLFSACVYMNHEVDFIKL